MSEDKKSLINLMPESIDNAIKNVTDKPTQNIGTTLADIWYLVFGSFSHAADKRKLKYSYNLQEFEKELKEKINKIPEDKRVEPDIQVIAPALEAAKYCIDKEELRKLFVELISNSMNKYYSEDVHPMFAEIIKQISSVDALVLKNICKYQYDGSLTVDVNDEALLLSLSALEKHGIIYTNMYQNMRDNKRIHIREQDKGMIPTATEIKNANNTIHIEFTQLGRKFCASL